MSAGVWQQQITHALFVLRTYVNSAKDMNRKKSHKDRAALHVKAHRLRTRFLHEWWFLGHFEDSQGFGAVSRRRNPFVLR